MTWLSTRRHGRSVSTPQRSSWSTRRTSESLSVVFTRRMENLQLLEQFGSNAYRMQNDFIDASTEKFSSAGRVTGRMDADLAGLQERTSVVNRKRKMDQDAVSEKLSNTEWQILELQMKNYQIEVSGAVWS